MKIVIFNSIYYPDVLGGAEISVKLLSEDLSNKGYDVTVICMAEQEKYETINGVKIWRLKERNVYFIKEYSKQNPIKKMIWHISNLAFNPNKKEIYNILNKIEPDLILSQNLLGMGFVPWIYAKENSIKIIQTIRDYNLLRPTKIKLINFLSVKIFKENYKYIDRFIGVSRYSLDYFLSLEENSIKSTSVIHNKVIVDQTKTNFEQKIENSVGFVGQITKEKGIYIFLETVTNPNLYNYLSQIYVVGDGPELNSIKNKYSKYDKIRFLGQVSTKQVNDIYSLLDFVIVPSLWNEPFGRVIIEAYNRGVYVYASKKGGIPEIIIDKSYLFDPNDESELIEKIKKKIISKNSSNDYSRKDLIFYASEFSENVSKYIDEINNINEFS